MTQSMKSGTNEYDFTEEPGSAMWDQECDQKHKENTPEISNDEGRTGSEVTPGRTSHGENSNKKMENEESEDGQDPVRNPTLGDVAECEANILPVGDHGPYWNERKTSTAEAAYL